MKIFILTLFCGLVGYGASKPLESTNTNDATDALIDWQSSSVFRMWPFQAPTPFTAFSAHGLNLLTPAHLDTTFQRSKSQEKLEKEQPPQLFSLGSPLPQLLQPQQLAAQTYFTLNQAFYDSPLTRYACTTSNQFLPQLLQNPTIESTTPAIKTQVKETEPTTKKPKALLKSKPPKLQLSKETSKPKAKNDFLNDKPLLEAVRDINPQFVVEDIMPVPGRHVYSSVTMEVGGGNKKTQLLTKKLKTKAPTPTPTTNYKVKVEAIGRTATTGNIPQIPFGTYFLPYFSQGQQQQQEEKYLQQQRKGKKQQGNKPPFKTASLILEPHSKAIVGNGGTAISAPISRAVLKRGVPTNVYFNPESVAIAGVGGKAHAQADLELDLVQ